ncbi:MAG: formamidopyrimidine-DNA glycosylase, partial [Acidobacteria bacterium]|nr:formamidopyrimidine-DNA glycosylase [Acidobacteriota bacterium]
MPELPDVVVYIEALMVRVGGQPLERFRIGNPFVVRTVDPPPTELEGRAVTGLRRMGKRIVFAFERRENAADDAEHALFMVVHLMVAGRFKWRDRGTAIPGKVGLAAWDFPAGTLILTEQGSKRQASIHVVRGRAALAEFERGGLEVLDTGLPAFAERLTRENHTVKRALTDPAIFSGIGNAYSDEILHAARLSPMRQTRQLNREEVARLFEATQRTLHEWITRTRGEVGDRFPERVTAFREGMAAHGRFGKPCPVCAAPIQRIVYARNECNYCAKCQTDGRLLSDRALSRLLREDWPKALEEME